MITFDVAVIGAGAAGMFAAARAGQAGRSVILIEHAIRLGEKIRISGGGRCNFTNSGTAPENFISENPDFCRSALAAYTPTDFTGLLRRHNIDWHEKHRGQLFCDDSATQIVDMLFTECTRGRVTLWQPCRVTAMESDSGSFVLDTDRGRVRAGHLVIATGGLSIPKIGASDFGLRAARQFGHRIVEPRPALVPLTFDTDEWQALVGLAGVALEVSIVADALAPPEGPARRRSTPPPEFLEDLLFTHRGLSGPAVLQASSYWRPGTSLTIDLAPALDLAGTLIEAKDGARHEMRSELARHLPARLAQTWLEKAGFGSGGALAQWRDGELIELATGLKQWRVTPSGSEGWRKAEVMAGGVATDELSSQTMESLLVPGLFFIGEIVDVTGWLGGYNFQWAWASAAACARALVQNS